MSPLPASHSTTRRACGESAAQQPHQRGTQSEADGPRSKNAAVMGPPPLLLVAAGQRAPGSW
jgi:hypothetical protein